jgi:hypothetical protein
VELGIVVVLPLLLGLRDAECEPVPDPSQLDQCLLHFRDARRALPRFDSRPATHNPSHSQPERKPEPLGENHDFFGVFPCPVELAALDMDNSTTEESDSQTERMFHALRQCHRRLAHNQCPVGMAKVHVTQDRIRVGVDARIESHRVRQRPMLAGIV